MKQDKIKNLEKIAEDKLSSDTGFFNRFLIIKERMISND